MIMRTLNREQLIEKIAAVNEDSILIPSQVFGKAIFLKATKPELITQIVSAFSAQQDTGVKLRKHRALHAIIIDTVAKSMQGVNSNGQSHKKVAGPGKKLGRPVGSKNRKDSNPGSSGTSGATVAA
jgi:hypothetical protein